MEAPPLSQSPVPVTASALIATLHQTFSHGPRAQRIDGSSTIVFGALPPEFVESIWAHAYRRAEDELVLISPAAPSSGSALFSAVESIPGIDQSVVHALRTLTPFLTHMTPENLSTPAHAGLGVSLSLNSEGQVVSARVSMPEQPLATLEPLLALDPELGNRSFDVFYHMLYSQEDHAEFLGLRKPSQYALLSKSDTYRLPEWVVFSDDRALAKDWADACHDVFSRDFVRDLMAVLSGILLLGQPDKPSRAEGAALVGLDPALSSKYSPRELIAASYLAIIDAMVANINVYLGTLDAQGSAADISSVITIVEATDRDRVHMLANVFDDSIGLNAEMANNGISLPKTPRPVTKALQKLAHQPAIQKLTAITDFASIASDDVQWPRTALKRLNQNYAPLDIEALAPLNRIWSVISLAPSAHAQDISNDVWSSSMVSNQLRNYYVTEWADKRGPIDFTADYGVGDFISEFRSILPSGPAGFQLATWADQRGYSPAEFFLGVNRIYVTEPVWQSLEHERMAAEGFTPGPAARSAAGFVQPSPWSNFHPSQLGPPSMYSFNPVPPPHIGAPPVQNMRGAPAPRVMEIYDEEGHVRQVEEPIGSHYSDEDGEEDFNERDFLKPYHDEEKDGRHIEVFPQTRERKIWVSFVWMLTWWIPSPLLKYIGRMKRSDMRIAWREKVVIFFLIFLLNAGITFYMIFLGRFICPDYDKVWNHKELAYHQGEDDFYVGIHGKVYDITKFYKIQHSDNGVKVTASHMLDIAGLDISYYFPEPLWMACPNLVTDEDVALSVNTTVAPYTDMMHTSGEKLVTNDNTALHNNTWYADTFQPKIQSYYKGAIVENRDDVKKQTQDDSEKYLIIINKKIYDVSQYMYTTNLYPSSESSAYDKYNFFDDDVVSMFSSYQGEDATDAWNELSASLRRDTLTCLDNAFYYGEIDFRKTAKCQAANVILLVFAGILTGITALKFACSLRFGSKPLPSRQDKFVICQIPAYTESEDELRLAIDSITSMDYDNQRKLLVLLCDGLITGAGNDRTTPQIILDIFGIDDRVDPEPKAYHAIAEGSKELNYGKVYSGLYESEGNIVPFVVVVKCGSPTEAVKPGNRGKRDSQLIMMNFLNRVHKQAAMNPLELEMFHHINNIIGIEPERYEYLFTIDADTKVMPDALTRLVAACTNDSKIAAVCGETGIQNEEQSLSTMIQVYEYFISHHLTKAFESLFGSVTCLPGCFTLYRLKTSQRARPLLISDDIIREYSIRHVDTLHKKNLFSLGEDRYLTTLLSKFFPKMSLKFIPDAKCLTWVPDEFSVLMSQRRRWINSTVHNLVELLRLRTLCGFCLFSMRGVVFVDLIGTLMLPSVCIYLGYLIYVIASKTSPLPIISIVLIASVYGLQACVYILHRRWQHIFWMIIYIAAYPFHSFLLPIYSFWYMDDFGWGNTRVVLDESQGKKVVLQDDNDLFDPRWVPMETWASYSTREGYPGAERPIVFDDRRGRILQNVVQQEYIPRSIAPSKMEATSYRDDQTEYTRYAPTMQTERVFDNQTLARLRLTVRQVLNSADLDSMTTRQLREKVADLLGVEFTRKKAAAVDEIIDEELDTLDEQEDAGYREKDKHDDPFEPKADDYFA